ncbi:hypothetical protein D3C80_1286780 [compost metagenome]
MFIQIQQQIQVLQQLKHQFIGSLCIRILLCSTEFVQMQLQLKVNQALDLPVFQLKGMNRMAGLFFRFGRAMNLFNGSFKNSRMHRA